MATFKIDDVEYDTENLDTTQASCWTVPSHCKMKAALNNLEIARAENRVGQKAQGTCNRRRREKISPASFASNHPLKRQWICK